MITCTSCQGSVPDAARFCGTCGSHVTPSAAAPAERAETAGADTVLVLPHPPEMLTLSHMESQFDPPVVVQSTVAQPVEAPPMEAAPAVVSAATADRPPGFFRRHRTALAASVVAVAFAALGAFAFTTRQDLSGTRGDLRSTRATLRATSATLAGTEADLGTTRAEVVSLTAARDDLKEKLAAKTTELQGVRGTLSDAKQRIGLQSSQIETLKSCLKGVDLALRYLAYSDYTSAIAALDAVEVSCTSAFKLF